MNEDDCPYGEQNCGPVTGPLGSGWPWNWWDPAQSLSKCTNVTPGQLITKLDAVRATAQRAHLTDLKGDFYPIYHIYSNNLKKYMKKLPLVEQNYSWKMLVQLK